MIFNWKVRDLKKTLKVKKLDRGGEFPSLPFYGERKHTAKKLESTARNRERRGAKTSNHACNICRRVYCLLHGIRQDSRHSCAIYENKTFFLDAMSNSKYHRLARFLRWKSFSQSALFERRNSKWLSPRALLLYDDLRVRRRQSRKSRFVPRRASFGGNVRPKQIMFRKRFWKVDLFVI